MQTISLSLPEISSTVATVLSRNGCDTANCDAIVRTIVAAERDGAISHGLFRLPGYIASLRSGKVDGKAAPNVEHVTQAIIRVDGNGGFSPLALELGRPALATAAQELGIAAMAITNTFHFAALWPETEALAKNALVAIAAVNSKPVMAPFGGRSALLGTNPVSLAYPRPGKDPVVFDMATSTMAHGELQIAAREGRKVPIGSGLDEFGNDTSDPAKILQGILLPFGGHKGALVALMVELLAAGITGELFGFEAEQSDNADGGPLRGGEFILAISPEVFVGKNWASHSESFFAKYESIDGVRLPGTRRFANRSSNTRRDIDISLWQHVCSL